MTEKIISKLKDNGVKITPQRIAIIKYLEKFKCHPTADDIYNHLTDEYPTMSLATVYNTLEKLEELGEILKLKISDNNKANYEYFIHPHDHFFCKSCKKIIDIENSSLYVNKDVTSEGHKINEIHCYIKGICKSCQ